MSTSRNKVVSGFLWSLSEKLLIQVIAFVVGLILARKLGPETYGLVATVSIIISLVTVATNLYMGTYLMRKKDVDSLDMNTSFYFNLFVNVVVYLVLFFTAPLLANFYGKSELSILLRIMGIGVLASSFMGIKLVVIVRNYQYKKLFFASLVGTLVAGITGITLAFTGFGPWALVAQHCLDCIVDTIILWIVVKWVPKFEFSFARLKEMLKYGYPLWFFGIADSLSIRLQQLIIGKKYTSSDLAYYNRGESFPSIIESNAVSALNNVLLRKVSEEQDNLESVKDILSKITKICLYISVPSMFGLAAVSSATIELLLGYQWMPSVVFMQIFCLAFAFKPIEATSDVALKAIGKTKQFLIFGLIKKSLFIVAVICSIPFGVKAIAIGFLLASILACLISIIANNICFKMKIVDQLLNTLLPLLSSTIMWVFVSGIGGVMINIHSAIVLLVQIVSGVFIYILLLFVIDRNSVLYFKALVSSILKKKKNKRG